MGGIAISDGAAISDGLYGGRAVSRSDSLADTWGGMAESRVRAISGATDYGSAYSDGLGVSVSGAGRRSHSTVRAESRAHRFGRSMSRASSVEIRR